MKTTEISLPAASAKLNEALSGRGAFLSVAAPGLAPNTMTIGWAQVGPLWTINVLSVFVRPSRYTAELLTKTDVFTVSVPAAGKLTEELAYCGSRSGREGDKFAACGLKALPGKTASSVIAGGCGLFFECKTLHAAPMHLDGLPPGLKKRCYPLKDYHTVYFGDIVELYEITPD